MDRNKVGARLRELRGNRTQAKVADALGIARTTYAMYEEGNRMPADEIKIRIAKYYKKSVNYIFFSD